jgi:hypothetical protein
MIGAADADDMLGGFEDSAVAGEGGSHALSGENVADLVAAFCRDTRTDTKSTGAEKFEHAIITSAAQNAITLRQRRLGMHCGVCLSKILKTHLLDTLDLYGNVLRDVGATALLQLVRSHRTLKHINLGSNDLGVESGVAFARELAGTPSFTLGTQNPKSWTLKESKFSEFGAVRGVSFACELANASSPKTWTTNTRRQTLIPQPRNRRRRALHTPNP